MGYATDFNTDYAQLKSDANAFIAFQSTSTDSILKQIDSCDNVFEIIALIYQTISPHIENKEAPKGAAEKILADLQKCNNDLHGMTNENSSSTSLVTEVSTDANKLITALSTTPTTTPKGLPANWETAVEAAVGSTATSGLLTNFQSISNTIYTGSGTPPPDTIYAGTGTVPSGAITNFAQMQANMSIPGDPSGASTIYHTFLTASNTITSTLTTQTNVANTELKLLSSEDKQWMSFGNDIIQSFEGVMKAAEQHIQNANG